MATIIYLHGLGSKGTGAKIDALRVAFPNDTVISPDLPLDPATLVPLVTNLVLTQVKSYPLIFVGTSLGGFWANYFAHKFDALCVLVNPSSAPSVTLKKYTSNSVFPGANPIRFCQDMAEKFRKCEEKTQARYNGALVNLFLAKDDKILQYKDAVNAFRYVASCKITADGGHRYESRWSDVVSKVGELIRSV